MIKIYDTKARAKVDLNPIEFKQIRMYVCGPTVYNYIHIGNARTFISFDMIRRYLEYRKFDVVYVSNITDVDDKIIKKANEEGRSAEEVAKEYTRAFIRDMHAVNVKDPTVRPKATQEIGPMIKLVEELIAAGHAYEVEGDVYFDVRSYDGYGELSGRNIDEMESGHRELRAGAEVEDRKHDPLDFAVWKAAKPGEPSWDSPWGKGRPGWHLECSAMARKYLGLPFDIHGGGADLCFPHHENERAQAEAVTGSTFAAHWMHSGMLQINSEKMSKSLGNFLLLRDVLKTTDPAVLRFLMLQTHYRSPLDFSEERLAEAKVALGRIKNAMNNIDWAGRHADGPNAALDADRVEEMIRTLRMKFFVAMDDDFNTPKAVGEIFDYITEVNAMIDGVALGDPDMLVAAKLRNIVLELMDVMGIDMAKYDPSAQGDEYPQELVALAAELAGFEGDDGAAAADALLAARAEARANKNWAVADAIRDRLGEIGFAVEDTAQGQRVVRR